MKKTNNILVTNDDGILAGNFPALVKVLSPFGRVVAVLPDRMRSACSHSISLHKALRLRKIDKDIYVSDGTPVDCVRLGVLEIFKDRADFVFSGINAGPNLGDDLNYSGTVAAAREAAFLGIKSASVSLILNKRFDFGAATEITGRIFPHLLRIGLPKGVFLNVNIPDIPKEKIKGIKVTSQGKRIYDRSVVARRDPRGGKYYWLSGEKLSGFMIKGTDIEAVSRNYVSVTPLTLDHTAHENLHVLKNVFSRFMQNEKLF